MAPARVLVVDDSPTMRGLISAVLNSDPDVDVIGQAGDALEARAAIKELNPDVVTLDIEMPNMNGLEFLRLLRAEPGGEVPKVIFCSVENDLERIREALDNGADEYIMKPFDGDIVASKLSMAGVT